MLSCGVVVMRPEKDGWRCLLLRCYGNWEFPKGGAEGDEAPMAAARREVEEETGLTRLDFRWGDDFRETEPYGRGKVARFYAAVSADEAVSLPVSAELGRPEHHEFRWAGFDEARRLLPARLHPVLDWARDVAGERPDSD